jgi:hypothetical protein
VSVGVEPDLDPVRIMQTHEDCTAVVAPEEPTVRLAEVIERGCPPLHVVPARDEQRDGVESRPRRGAVRVMPKGDLRLAVVAAKGDSFDYAVLDELRTGLETEHAVVPGSAACDVADRQLDVMDADEHDNPPCSSTLESAVGDDEPVALLDRPCLEEARVEPR